MDRKGKGIGLVVEIAIGLFVFFLVFYFLKMSGGALSGTVTCDTSDPQYQCVDASAGCRDVGSRVIYKFRGCDPVSGKSQVCCLKDTGGSGFTHTIEPQLTLRAYQIDADIYDEATGTFKTGTVKDLTPISHGASVIAVKEIPKAIMIELEVENCKECLNKAQFVFKAETAAGDEVLHVVADRLRVEGKKTIKTLPEQLTEANLTYDPAITASNNLLLVHKAERGSVDKIWQTDRSFVFTFPPEFTAERIKFTAKVTYEHAIPSPSGQPPPENPVTKTYSDETVVNFDVKTPVRYGGLTTVWSKSKTVTAVCVEPVECQNMYFKILKSDGPTDVPPACPLLKSTEATAATELIQQHCVIDTLGGYHGCFPTNKECWEEGLPAFVSNDYAAAFEALKVGVQEGLIPENVLIPFQVIQTQESFVSCQPSIPIETSGGGQSIFSQTFKINEIQDTEQWQFTLNTPSMTAQYLCVYGQNAYNENQFFTAGKPKQIRVDRIPPIGKAKFHPATLRITFQCDDAHSGCESYRGISYISSMDKFLPALMSGKSQKASVWCPPFATNAAYRTESRQEIPYADDMVRVMCVRSVDKAGNAAVSMTTVYNGWQMLAALLQKFVVDNAPVQGIST